MSKLRRVLLGAVALALMSTAGCTQLQKLVDKYIGTPSPAASVTPTP